MAISTCNPDYCFCQTPLSAPLPLGAMCSLCAEQGLCHLPAGGCKRSELMSSAGLRAGRSSVCPGEALPASQNWPLDLPPMPSMPEMPPFGSAYMGNPESMAFQDATQETRPMSSRTFGLPSGWCMHQD